MEVPWSQAGHRGRAGHGKGLACNMIYAVMYRVKGHNYEDYIMLCKFEHCVPDPVCPSKIYVFIYVYKLINHRVIIILAINYKYE